jgi:hypothetical protein
MSQRYQGGFITASYNGLKVPNAPTIGTATSGNATASVTFTAPADIGGGAITGYTVVSTPGAITGTGTSSPITVSGLTNDTAYTFKVFATNAYGPSPFSAASNSTTPQAPPTVIGQAYGGGYYGGKINVSGTQYYLLVADKTVGEAYQKTWGVYGTSTSANSIIDGPTNSATLAALGSAYEAATFCETLNTGGYTDWYLPAKDEIQVLYYFLKPGTDDNDTAFGSNAYAVSPQPVSTNYTAGSPAQTSATSFRTGASSQEFAVSPGTGKYWTSTQYSGFTSQLVWCQRSTTGGQPAQTKNSFSDMYTRAIRRVAV